MSVEEQKSLVPRLRFPGFQEKGNWEEKLLRQIGEFIGGGTPDTTVSEYWDGDIPWYTPTEVKEFYLKRSNRTITKKGLQYSSAKLLPAGTLLITTRATIGDIAIAEVECTTNQGFQSLIVNESEVNIFWYYWLVQHKKELIKKASGSTFPEIGKTEIVKINILRPSREEQQKIADCLSSLDELIAAHTEKLTALKAHKKGLMQQLFPAEGETVPKLRFAAFAGSGDWEEKKLREITPQDKKHGIVDGPFGSNLKTIHYKNEGIPIIASGYVTEGKFAASNYLYITPEKFEEEKRSAAKGGDIIMAKIGARCGASAILPVSHDTGILSSNALKITVDEESYSTQFIWQQLWHLYQNQKLNILIKVGAQPSISLANLKEFVLKMPSGKDEQIRIADCLSSLDNLITTQTENIAALKRHKKGLMQGLFPAVS